MDRCLMRPLIPWSVLPGSLRTKILLEIVCIVKLGFDIPFFFEGGEISTMSSSSSFIIASVLSLANPTTRKRDGVPTGADGARNLSKKVGESNETPYELKTRESCATVKWYLPRFLSASRRPSAFVFLVRVSKSGRRSPLHLPHTIAQLLVFIWSSEQRDPGTFCGVIYGLAMATVTSKQCKQA